MTDDEDWSYRFDTTCYNWSLNIFSFRIKHPLHLYPVTYSLIHLFDHFSQKKMENRGMEKDEDGDDVDDNN